MEKTGKDKLVWAELQRQLDSKGLSVKRGTIQDATFIEADPGSANRSRGDDAKTRRSRDGTWAKKGDEIHFGYKFHLKVDMDYGLIREIQRLLLRYMIVKSIYLQKEKWFSEIKGILEL